MDPLSESLTNIAYSYIVKELTHALISRANMICICNQNCVPDNELT